MDVGSTTARFFLAATVVLLVCRLVTVLMRRVGQPPVIGEMVAGVLLGPSLLGLVAPGVQDALFPDAVRPMLYVVSHIGLVAFMFEVGHEYKSHRVRGVGRSAGLISSAGVALPFLLGMLLVFGVGRGQDGVLASGIPLWASAMFVGVTLAITAFPMLARIISERGLTNTRYGSLSLACGAFDDAIAWVLLAVVIGSATGNPGKIVLTAGGSVLFVLFVVFVARPVLAWIFNRPMPVEQLILVTAVALFAAAWFTDTIGLYSVFGGFCLGFVFPSGPVADRVVGMISPVTKTVFLPLFFAYSGLNTQFGLLVSPPLLLLSLAFVLAAIVGKFGGCAAAARLSGERPDVAVRVGVLMNARGLMQLIALNVGLQAGIATPALFSALVLVALVTTIMTPPWLSFLDRREPAKPSHADESVEPSRTLTARAPDDEGEPG